MRTPNDVGKPVEGISSNLWRWGLRSWLFLGIALFAVGIVTFLTTISGVFVPAVVAVVLAMIFYPMVDYLAAHHVPRTLGTLLVIVLLIAVLGASAWIMMAGISSQGDEIVSQLDSELTDLGRRTTLYLPASGVQQIRTETLSLLPNLVLGLIGFFFSGFSGVFVVILGGFTALFLLFYLLSGWHDVSAWVSRHLGTPEELGADLVKDSTEAVRAYFYGVTVANLPIAAAVGITMSLLGLPLAIPVALVTMITSYIPYLGAIFSGAFAALVAFSAGGFIDAAIVLAVIVGLQNILDPIISNYVTSDKLDMNPIVTLLTTLVGGILFGALGATLASPATAVLLEAQKQIRAYRTSN